ncbi:hypothetical protein [Sediminibacter sp. Hel_I_10]|uniref:hypothetical protein n=1 Tax=Sediminibacter sp. Hel_I_10 TaxID=1392490 RepID=UPI00047882B2|nr:hypothetical protein [Sediminibacter sp. Hel_I_10]
MENQKKHKRNLKKILGIAFGLSIFGFFLDLNELDPSLLQNGIDISLMTVLFFGVGFMVYVISVVLKKWIAKAT